MVLRLESSWDNFFIHNKNNTEILVISLNFLSYTFTFSVSPHEVLQRFWTCKSKSRAAHQGQSFAFLHPKYWGKKKTEKF